MSFEIKYDRNGNVITPPPAVPDETPEPAVHNIMLQPPQEPTDWPQEPEPENIIPDQPDEPAVAAPPEPKPKSAEYNWRALNEEKQRLEYENRMLKEAQQKAQQYQQPEEDLTVNLNDDDLAEGRHLSKVNKKIQKLEKQLVDYQTRMQQLALENQIKSQYPDFEKVVSAENVSLLNANEPELAMSIGANRDPYSQAIAAYKAIKRMGVVPEVSQVDQEQVERVKKNTAKPKTTASISTQSESPLARANAFVDGKITKELQNKLYREMLDAMKRS